MAIALAITGTVLLGMLALLTSALATRADVRDDLLALRVCQQLHQSLLGYEEWRDKHFPASGDAPGPLDPLLPFDFAAFPPSEPVPFVLGFDTNGKRTGGNLTAEYAIGTRQENTVLLATLAGRTVPDKPGLTEIVIGIETPADAPRENRERREFSIHLTPGGRAR